jgi:hypothetical protein
MANITITAEDNAGPVIKNGEYRDALLTFAGADTYVAGTILAQRLVADTVVVAADAGNTGNGTCTAASVTDGPVVPLVGAYTLICTAEVAHGGVFQLKDPNGAIVLNTLTLTAGAGVATVFEGAGLTFTLTDGTEDFDIADFFTITVAAVTGKYEAYVSTGKGGVQIPKTILTYPITVTGSGDVRFRYPVSGTFNFNELVIDADGTNANISEVVINQLRAYGCEIINVQTLGVADNS